MRPIGEPTPGASERKQGTLLLVEDERDNVMVAELQLRRRYDVLVATTDREACEHLHASAPQIDAVLMDIQLRGSSLDGYQLAHVMRGGPIPVDVPAFAQDLPAACRTMPVLFVTAFADAREFDFSKVGASGVVSKPINFSELNLKLTQLYLARISAR
jgi:CheY-like chemotaxis protein